MRGFSQCATAWVTALLLQASALGAEDVRVLIDLAKGADENRQAALALIDRLSDADQAAVLSFGRYVKVVALPGRANGAWRARAATGVAGLEFDAEQSRLGKALEKAAFDAALPGTTPRIVVVTAAKADFEAAGAWIERGFDVEFANHSAAVERLAARAAAIDPAPPTGATTAVIESSDATVPVDLPADSAHVPAGCAHALFLLRRDGPNPGTLIDPTGRVFDANTAFTVAPWYVDRLADLVYIERPAPGIWRAPATRLRAFVEPEIAIAGLPDEVFPGFENEATLRLVTRGGAEVTDRLLLDLLVLEAVLDGADGAQPLDVDPMFDPAGELESSFTAELKSFTDYGDYEVRVDALTPVATLGGRRAVRVADPVSFQVASEEPGWALVARLEHSIIDPASVRLKALVSLDGGPRNSLTMRADGDRTWRVEVPAPPSKKLDVELEIVGNYLSEKRLKLRTRGQSIVVQAADSGAPQGSRMLLPDAVWWAMLGAAHLLGLVVCVALWRRRPRRAILLEPSAGV